MLMGGLASLALGLFCPLIKMPSHVFQPMAFFKDTNMKFGLASGMALFFPKKNNLWKIISLALVLHVFRVIFLQTSLNKVCEKYIVLCRSENFWFDLSDLLILCRHWKQMSSKKFSFITFKVVISV